MTRSTRPASSRLATRAEAVKALGLPSPRALDRLIEKGAPGPAPGKRGTRRYDVAAMQAWKAQRATEQRPTLDLTQARAKLATTQEKLAALKVRELRGTLIRRTDALEVQRAIATATRTSLLAVPRRAVLAGVPREHEPVLTRLVKDALRELSEVQTFEDLTRRGEADA